MKLTRRGTVAVAGVLLTLAFAWAFGQRALNAVAAPLVAALVVAVTSVWRAERPTARYDAVQSGQTGETRTIVLDVEGSGLAAVSRPLPDGLGGADIGAVVSLPHRFEQTVTLDQRGIYDIDPPTVVQRDAFGFVERSVDVRGHTSLVVYPETYDLADPTLDGLFTDSALAERQAFDHLREYTPSDALRDIHWKSSAKHDEFLVVEYESPDRYGEVSVVASADRGHGDEMAAAAATLTLSALEAGLAVDLHLPDDRFYCDPGSDRESLLRLLAEAEAGPAPERAREEADLLVHSGVRGTSLRLPGGYRRFESLVSRTDHQRGQLTS